MIFGNKLLANYAASISTTALRLGRSAAEEDRQHAEAGQVVTGQLRVQERAHLGRRARGGARGGGGGSEKNDSFTKPLSA